MSTQTFTSVLTDGELDETVTSWFDTDGAIVETDTIGHWLTTGYADLDYGNHGAPSRGAETLGMAFVLAMDASTDEHYADADEFVEAFKRFETPQVDEDGDDIGEEIEWEYRTHTATSTVAVLGEYQDDSGELVCIALPPYYVSSQLTAAFDNADTDHRPAMAALRLDLIGLLAHVRDHLHLFPTADNFGA